MLKIKNKVIFDELGRALKKIECPYDVTPKDLKQVDAEKLFCNRCSKNIIDTDFMSELTGTTYDNQKNYPKLCSLGSFG